MSDILVMLVELLIVILLMGLILLVFSVDWGRRRQRPAPKKEKAKRDVPELPDVPTVPYDLYRTGEIYRRVPFNRDIPRSYTVGDDGELEERGWDDGE